MRLDSYLVETGFLKSRGRAKRAIEEGKVKLNGVVCTKPSKNVSVNDKVDIEEGLDMPRGYFKLKAIQERTGLIRKGDNILDLGSSAGGFLMCAAEVLEGTGHIHGIEFSRDFRQELGQIAHDNENVSVMFDDVFTVDIDRIPGAPFDVLLSDMTLEPLDSVKALKRICPLLKEEGRLLQVIKIPKNKTKMPVIKKIRSAGFDIIDMIEPERQEVYFIAVKKQAAADDADNSENGSENGSENNSFPGNNEDDERSVTGNDSVLSADTDESVSEE